MGAERRPVTVVFCDLVDSTSWSQRLDPEELRELVQSYHACCAQAIERHSGHLAQYLGDGVLAYFGYPVAHEQDARSAIAAGLAIVREMETRPEIQGMRLCVRVGIHSGLVVAGEIEDGGVGNDLPVGSTVPIAARLQAAAGANRVVISEATYALTRGFYECRDLGTPAMKGVETPIRVYEVLGKSGAESPLDAAASSGLTPLVGRERERDLLLERWHDLREGNGQVVLVHGDAGVGKSRLLRELKRALRAEHPDLLECRCSPHHESSALFPVIDLLRRTWNLVTGDAASRRDRLADAIAPIEARCPDALPLMASFLSVPAGPSSIAELSPQRRRQLTLETLVEIFVHRSRCNPLLLVVEDLHWIDPSTLEFLGLLIERSRGERILHLLTFRPSFTPPWDDTEKTEIVLERLTADESRRLIHTVAGGRELPAEVVDELCQRADGVPLYLEELTKMMLESGQLREKDSQLELVAPTAGPRIPATLQQTLMARLDGLSDSKEVAQLAATIGRFFSFELIRSVGPFDGAALGEKLGRLVDAGVLFVTGAPPRADYVFRHALIQEAAYESLLKHTRREYHRQIVEALKAHFADVVETQPEILGHHAAGAGLTDEAVAYYQLAGHRAIERSADAEAVSHLIRALKFAEALPDGEARTRIEIDLRIDLGVALVAAKGIAAPEVERVYLRARELCESVGDTQQLYNALSGIFLYHQARGELRKARELTQQRLRVAAQLGDDGLVMQVRENLGTLAFWRGDFEAAIPSLDEALGLYDEERARELALVYGTESGVVCETYTAQALWFLGRPDSAKERCERSVERARTLGHANSFGLALAFAAALHQLRREPHLVRRYADETVAFSADQKLPFWRGFGMIFQGLATVALGGGEPGIARTLEGVASFQQTGAGLGGAYCVAMLADAHLQLGHAEQGLATLAGGLKMIGDYEDEFFDAEVARIRGSLLLAAGDEDRGAAEQCFREALARARGQHAAMLELRASTSLARLLFEQGDRESGRELLDEALAQVTEGADTPDVTEAMALRGELSAP